MTSRNENCTERGLHREKIWIKKVLHGKKTKGTIRTGDYTERKLHGKRRENIYREELT